MMNMNDMEEYFDTPAGKIISQIQGFMEIGMHKETVKLAKQLLKSEPIDSLMFQQAIDAFLVGGYYPKRLKALVYSAYDRLSHTDQRNVQEDMLYFTSLVKDMSRAQEFVPAQSSNPITLLRSMEVCLENKAFEKAYEIRSQCLELLNETSEEFGISLLLDALANYAERFGNYDEAEKYWLKQICLDQPTIPSAVRGLIKNKAAQAWKHVQLAQAQIHQFRGNIDSITVLALPGNHDCLLNEAQKNLNTYRKALAKILPEKDLPKYGIE